MPVPFYAYSPTFGLPYRFVYKMDSIQETFSIDSNISIAIIECNWDTSSLLKQDLMGYTEPAATGVSAFNRNLPLQSGYYPTQWLSRMEMVQFWPEPGPSPDTVYPDPLTAFPQIEGKIHYKCTFGNLPYALIADTALVFTGGMPGELLRYVRVEEQVVPEMQKMPSAGFECYDPASTPSFVAFPVSEVGSLPIYHTEITVTAMLWLYTNRPRTAIAATVGLVNNANFIIDGITYPAGTLIYKGPDKFVPYFWLDGNRYCDIPHKFGFRPNGWNAYRRSAATWFPLRVKNTTSTPPFAAADFTQLFLPQTP